MKQFPIQQTLKWSLPIYKNGFKRDLLYIFILLVFMFSLFLGTRPLNNPDEGRYSEIPREMVATGDYITPKVNEVKFLDKPPLFFWGEAASIKVFGLNTWSLRAVPALFAILGCLLVYLFIRSMFNSITAWISSITLATSPLYFSSGHYINVDMAVAVLITGSLLCFCKALNAKHISSKNNNLIFLLGYIFIGLSVLTKGLIAIFFPAAIIGIWFTVTRQWHLIRHIKLFSGIMVFLIITLPWFILVQLKNPEFFRYFFIHQHFERFLLSGFNNRMPFWFYFPVFIGTFFPWSMFLIQSIYDHLKKRKGNLDPKITFMIIWLFTVLIFFSIPESKILSYILPAFPPASILVGIFLKRCWLDKPNRLLIYGFKAIIAISISIVLFAFLVSFGVITFKHPLNNAMNLYLCLIGIMCAISPYYIYRLYLKYGLEKAFYRLCIFIFILLLIVLNAIPLYVKDSTKNLAYTIKPLLKSSDEVMVYYEYYYDLALYLERRITVIGNWNEQSKGRDNYKRHFYVASQHQDTKEWIIGFNEFIKRWGSKSQKFIFMNTGEVNSFKAYLKINKLKFYEVVQNKNIKVFANHKLDILNLVSSKK